MAGDWRRIELSRDQISAGELEKIREQFSVFSVTGATAADVAIFTRRTRSGGSEVYFSPAALPYAEFVFEHYPPCACNRPALLGTTLLVGIHSEVASLLGNSPDVQSLRRNAEQSPAVDVSFLQPDNPKAPGE
jgi:hypothetical protein